MRIIGTTFLILILPVLLLGQEIKNQEIEVLGIGKLTTDADFATIIFSIATVNDDKKLVYKKLNDDSELLKNELISFGFSKEQITMTDFNVTDNDEEYDKRPKGAKRYEGYRGVMMKYSFDYSITAKFIEKIAASSINYVFKFRFELSEEKKKIVRTKLIEQALSDAKEKAQLIADTYKVKLKRIIKIRYGEQSFVPNIEVRTVELISDTVTLRSVARGTIGSPSVDYRETIEVTWEFE